tara:strand:- start:418 stop:630 length:213 start_codon:yes stop_codon:yes gene_type:complete
MQGRIMANSEDTITYELECSECGAEYEIHDINTSKNEPIYCPYCGADIDLADIEEDEHDELDYDEDDYQP